MCGQCSRRGVACERSDWVRKVDTPPRQRIVSACVGCRVRKASRTPELLTLRLLIVQSKCSGPGDDNVCERCAANSLQCVWKGVVDGEDLGSASIHDPPEDLPHKSSTSTISPVDGEALSLVLSELPSPRGVYEARGLSAASDIRELIRQYFATVHRERAAQDVG